MSTKADIINKAYSRARISGLTKLPSPEDLELALDRLENMAAIWEEQSNICLGYNFEDTPDTSTPHLLPRHSWSAFESNLALMILSDFGKDPSQTLVMEATGTFSMLSGATANTEQINPPTRMPVGSGNSLKRNRYQRFFRSAERAPNDCQTVRMIVGEVEDLTEHFDDYLKLSETVSSYTITSDKPNDLTVSADSLTSPDISYRATAVTAGVFTVTIKATTSLGRVDIRKIYFSVSEA